MELAPIALQRNPPAPLRMQKKARGHVVPVTWGSKLPALVTIGEEKMLHVSTPTEACDQEDVEVAGAYQDAPSGGSVERSGASPGQPLDLRLCRPNRRSLGSLPQLARLTERPIGPCTQVAERRRRCAVEAAEDHL